MVLRHETEEVFSIYAAHDNGGSWSGPHQVVFSEQEFDPYEPTIAPDGSILAFNSRAPWPGADDPPVDGPRLWMSERQGEDWKVKSAMPTACYFQPERWSISLKGILGKRCHIKASAVGQAEARPGAATAAV